MRFWRRLRSPYCRVRALGLGLVRRPVLLASALLPLSAQEWKTTALASFDEAWKTINDTFYDPTFGGRRLAGGQATNCGRASRARRRPMRRACPARNARAAESIALRAAVRTASDALPGPATCPADVRVDRKGVVITRVNDPAAAAAGLAAGQAIAVHRRPAGRRFCRRVLRASNGARQALRCLAPRESRALRLGRIRRRTVRVREVSGAERTVVARRTMGDGEMTTSATCRRCASRSKAARWRRRAAVARASSLQRVDDAVERRIRPPSISSASTMAS